MKASELRIGNYIQWNNFKEARIMNDKDFSVVYQSLLEMNCEEIKPIPITEEWLLKLGFVSNPYQDRYEIGKDIKLHVECDKTKGEVMLWIEDLSHIKYVHQLQNLCYLMFNEELTINQP